MPAGFAHEMRDLKKRGGSFSGESFLRSFVFLHKPEKATSRGVFLLPFVRTWPTPSKRNPLLRGGRSTVHQRWFKKTSWRVFQGTPFLRSCVCFLPQEKRPRCFWPCVRFGSMRLRLRPAAARLRVPKGTRMQAPFPGRSADSDAEDEGQTVKHQSRKT